MDGRNARGIIRWRGADGGLEHLVLSHADGWLTAEGVVVGGDEQPYGLRYRIACDERWRARQALVDLAGEERRVRLSADGEGSWRADGDRPLPELEGCIDLDLAATPFTNTLPVRRLGLAPGQTAEIRVAYVAVPSLEVFAVTQRYTRLGEDRYRYEGYPPGFSAEITVDGEGLVVDYPGLFERVR